MKFPAPLRLINLLLSISMLVYAFSSCSLRGKHSGMDNDIQVVIVGGGASGVSAGVHAARLGVKVAIIEEGPWLGGMLTSAGVSAIDGNHLLPSGFWGEFRDSLIQHYGNQEALSTGWVSRTLFEPSVGNDILRNITHRESNLSLYMGSSIKLIERHGDKWKITVKTDDKEEIFYPRIVIDGTELGDVAKLAGVKYDVGMESKHDTGEDIAPEVGNDVIQDLTFVATLKDYGTDMTIEKPEGYDAATFACACENSLCVKPQEEGRLWSPERLISYGKLPNNKYMINWPIEGNDYYTNLIDKSSDERKAELEKAKQFTLQFVYFIQTELGMNTLSLADDEYPTDDLLPMIPYHRESRRIHGLTRFTLPHITHPYSQKEKLYRTAVAVGDYPVDHHHSRYPDWENLPDISFYAIPSYGLPMGVVIPKDVKGLIVTEKSISVSNIVNGTTRLQPVVLQIGQVAGTLAALAIQHNKEIEDISVREVQKQLLEDGAYLLPYLDVEKSHPLFKSLQRVGVCGILQGVGKNEGWANQTWFRANDPLYYSELQGMKDIYPNVVLPTSSEAVTISSAIDLINQIATQENIDIDIDIATWAEENFKNYQFEGFNINRIINRGEMALLIDVTLSPFSYKEVDIYGHYTEN